MPPHLLRHPTMAYLSPTTFHLRPQIRLSSYYQSHRKSLLHTSRPFSRFHVVFDEIVSHALDPIPLNAQHVRHSPPPSNSIPRDYTVKMPYKLLCLENPILDLQARGDDALLAKYKLKANDAILAGPEHLPLYDDLLSRNAVKIAGGAAQNTARGVAYILPAHSVLYIGAVGKDDAAKTLEEASATAGLDTEYMYVPDIATGRCGVVITGNNRSLCTDLAAANHYKVDHLRRPEIWAHAEAAESFYVGGYHLTVSPEAADTLGAEAAKKNKIFVLNLSAPFIPLAFKDPLAKTIRYADVVIGNETEMACWAEAAGWEESKRGDCKAIAQAIAALPKENTKRTRTVIVTQGTEPTLVVKDGQVSEYPVHAIDPSQINDTNGAGDAFAGGFMAGLVEGKDVKTCVDMGQWLARLSIQELGPSYPKQKLTYTPTS